MFMSRTILLTSALALGAVHCAGSSNRGSDMPEGSSGEQGSAEQGGASVPVPEPAPSVGLGRAPGDNTTGGADPTGSRPFERNPNDGATPSSSTDTAGVTATPLNDQQIATVTDKVNTAEIEQARIAQSKSKNAQVRRFAEMMIEHHGRAKTQQQALGLGSAESALSRQLEQSSKATLETLKAKTGDDFDRAYLQAQVEGHQEALDTIRQLQPSAQGSELRAYLDNLTPQVEQHLEQARAAQQALQSRAGSGATGMR